MTQRREVAETQRGNRLACCHHLIRRPLLITAEVTEGRIVNVKQLSQLFPANQPERASVRFLDSCSAPHLQLSTPPEPAYSFHSPTLYLTQNVQQLSQLFFFQLSTCQLNSLRLPVFATLRLKRSTTRSFPSFSGVSESETLSQLLFSSSCSWDWQQFRALVELSFKEMTQRREVAETQRGNRLALYHLIRRPL